MKKCPGNSEYIQKEALPVRCSCQFSAYKYLQKQRKGSIGGRESTGGLEESTPSCHKARSCTCVSLVTGVDGSFGKGQDPKLMPFQVSVPLVLCRA